MNAPAPASEAAQAPSHLVWVDWKMHGERPDWGYESITFPFTVHDGPWKRCYYHAWSFWFRDENADQGYTGLLAWGDEQYAKFSCFGDGVTMIDDVNCWPGADGGPGCGCEILIPHVPGREYLYTVECDSITGLHGNDPAVWHGWCTDTVTGDEYRIGTWRVPDWWKGLDWGWVGFHEVYTWIHCHDIPYSRVTYGVPYSTSGEVTGYLSDPYHSPQSRCPEGSIGFNWWREPGGAVTIETGFKDRRRNPDPEPCAPVVNVEVNLDVHCGASR